MRAWCYLSATSFLLGLMGRVCYQAYGLPPAIRKLEYLKPQAPPPDAFQSRPGNIHRRHFPPFFPLTRRRVFFCPAFQKSHSPCLFSEAEPGARQVMNIQAQDEFAATSWLPYFAPLAPFPSRAPRPLNAQPAMSCRTSSSSRHAPF